MSEVDYADPVVRDALRREWSQPKRYAEHQVIHDLLATLDGALDRREWEVAVLRQCVENMPATGDCADFMSVVSTAMLTARTTPAHSPVRESADVDGGGL